jgi:hypothetical protein
MSTPLGSEFRPVHPDRLPTLTEVLELGRGDGGLPEERPLQVGTPVADWSPAPPPPPLVPAEPPVPATPTWRDTAPLQAEMPDVDALVALVLAELQPRLELMFEARVREAVAPTLARAADLLIREVRPELASVLRDLVTESVARAVAPRKDP